MQRGGGLHIVSPTCCRKMGREEEEEVTAFGLQKLLAYKLDLFSVQAGYNYSSVSVQLFLESWNRCLLGAFKRNLNQITVLKLGASHPQLG